MTTPEAPPEAKLIARLREAQIPALSMRGAAKRAGMSPALWTQNEQGHRKVAPGVTIPIRATPDKLASMALVVGAVPQQLRDAGREDAASILERLIAAGPDENERMIEAVRSSREFNDAQKQTLIKMIEHARTSTR